MSPGAIALTRIPNGPHSTAICFVSMASPAFADVYAPLFGPGTTPFMEVILMITPFVLALRMATAQCCATMKAPTRFTRITESKSSWGRSISGPKRTMPALLTTRSGVVPNCSSAFATDVGSPTSQAIAWQCFRIGPAFSIAAWFMSKRPTAQPSSAS